MPQTLLKTILIVLLLTQSAWARPSGEASRLADLFRARFDHDYAEGRCGHNIMRLLKNARSSGIDVSNARMIRVTNDGSSVFGLVNVERARGGIRESTGEQRPPEEKNWYFHVFLELDCWVFDFDLLNAPVVASLPEYLELMFLDEVEPELPFYRVGREEKLKSYKVEVFRGRDVFDNPGKPSVESTMPLEQLLKSCAGA